MTIGQEVLVETMAREEPMAPEEPTTQTFQETLAEIWMTYFRSLVPIVPSPLVRTLRPLPLIRLLKEPIIVLLKRLLLKTAQSRLSQAIQQREKQNQKSPLQSVPKAAVLQRKWELII